MTSAPTCALCARPIALNADTWRLLPGGRYEHLACPVSEEMASLPPAPSPAPGVERLPSYLTLDEAAQLLRVSKSTVRARIRAGRLPAVRLQGGQTVLVEKQHALALLEPFPVPASSLRDAGKGINTINKS